MLRPSLVGVVCAGLVLSGCSEREPGQQKKGFENTAALCSDKLDDDYDDLVDCEDTDCAVYCNVVPETNCHNTTDDDFDGTADCADSDCQGSTFCGPETTDELCHDGLDNDADGTLDCADSDCQGSPDVSFCGPETGDDACLDRIDNDADGALDCDDDDCAAALPCQPGSPETSEAACGDGSDNDGDGRADCLDTECQDAGFAGCAALEDDTLCDDHVDNDGDHNIDCADSGCQDSTACHDVTPEADDTACQDGDDNDNDTKVDCADADCLTGASFCGAEDTAERCSDHIDNDGSGTVDCADTACAVLPACTPAPVEDSDAECSDKADNDNDTLVDCADNDCKGKPFCTPETTVANCQDAFDNDGDGTLDCNDVDCATTAPCDPALAENTVTRCGDTLDNDADGLVDCADTGCNGVGVCEAEEHSCTDHEDNDGDGNDDCQDSDCALDVACVGAENCTNETDDDADGFVDCKDFDCSLDFAITACDAPALTVHDLQDATDNDVFTAPRGDEVNDAVRLSGLVVTFVDPTFDRVFYVADQGAAGPYKNVRVYQPFSAEYDVPAVGTVVKLAGIVTEFLGETEIFAYALETAAPVAVPAAAAASVADLSSELPVAERANDRLTQDPADDLETAERYEGGLVQLTNVQILSVHFDELDVVSYEVAQRPVVAGAPHAFVGVKFSEPDDFLSAGQVVDSVQGHLEYYRAKVGETYLREWRIEPRMPEDWQYTLVEDDDFDGLSNEQEVLVGTDPFDPDSDSDWIDDGVEVGDVSVPADSDSDGVIDALESFLLDRDGDEVPDELDAVSRDGATDDRDLDGVANDEDDDDDGDGVLDTLDNCPYAPESPAGFDWPSSAQVNTDESEIFGDAYDLSDSGDACDFDLDGDFWPNTVDNCPFHWNYDQADSDADGFGDECDNDDVLDSPLACDDPSIGGHAGCDVIVEEVLYRLTTSLPSLFDANHDGRADIKEDEFVELRNVSTVDLDLSGLVLQDVTMFGTTNVRHRFPEGTILRRGRRVVVFGGGTPAGFPSYVTVQKASSGALELNNNGAETIYLVSQGASVGSAADDEILAYLDFGLDGEPVSPNNVSLTRYPEGTNWPEGNALDGDAESTFIAHPARFDAVGNDTRRASPARAPDNGKP